MPLDLIPVHLFCKPVYNLDETWANDSTRRCIPARSVDRAPTGKGGAVTALHTDSEKWDTDVSRDEDSLDYHHEIDGTCFEKWFTQQLPSNDDDNSVIVMSNAAYHSVPLEKLPSSSTLTISSCGSTTRASRSLPTVWNLNFWRLCFGVRRFSSYRVDTTANPQGVMLSAFQPTTAKLIPLRWSGVRLKDSLL